MKSHPTVSIDATSGRRVHGAPARTCAIVLLASGLAMLAQACGSSSRATRADRDTETMAVLATREKDQAPNSPGSPPPAFIGSEGVPWEAMQPMLVELAGDRVLTELVLDRELVKMCNAEGVSITQADLSAEEARFHQAIALVDRQRGGDSDLAIARVREARGLGPVRFAKLIERTARLRKLIEPSIAEPTEQDLHQLHEALHGEKLICRVIVTPTLGQASELRNQLLGEPTWRPERFAAMAIARSTDPSSVRGGRLQPFNINDPIYPASIRQAAAALTPGDISPAIAVESGPEGSPGVALVLLESREAAENVPFASVRDAMRERLILARQRDAMDVLARRLVTQASVTARDESLSWRWRRRARDANSVP